MRLTFDISLPDRDLYRVGQASVAGLTPVDWGACVVPGLSDRGRIPDLQVVSGLGSGVEIRGRSMKGYRGRELNRFFPLLLCLEALTRIDEWHLEYATHGDLPTVYAAHRRGLVRYEEEPPGQEDWLDWPTVLRNGWGDCEDLGCARTGELRWHLGEPAVPAIRFKDFDVDGQLVTLVHVLTLRANGQVEDPSKQLGMGGSFNHSV